MSWDWRKNVASSEIYNYQRVQRGVTYRQRLRHQLEGSPIIPDWSAWDDRTNDQDVLLAPPRYRNYVIIAGYDGQEKIYTSRDYDLSFALDDDLHNLRR